MSQVRDFTTSLCLVTASESKMSLVAVMPPKEFLSKMYPDEAESGPNAENQNYDGGNNRRNREERRLLKKVAQIILEEHQQRNLEQEQQNAHQMGPEKDLEEVDPYLDQVQEQQQQRQPFYQQTEEPYLQSEDYEVRTIFLLHDLLSYDMVSQPLKRFGIIYFLY